MSKKRRSTPIRGLSFSWRRATGVTKMKRSIAKATGIPTTRNGRNAKFWRMLTGGGCLVNVVFSLLLIAIVIMCI